MNVNQHTKAVQQQRVRAHADQTDSYAFFNLITGPRLLEVTESLLPPHRERLFPPTGTLSMFVAQALAADRSCQQAVDTAAIKHLIGGLPRCSTSTGAYCKARQRLPLSMVSTLALEAGLMVAEGAAAHWLWRGRPVRQIDGTTLSLPDTEANQERYPQPASQEPGLGFPQCRLVALTCLASGAVLNAAISPCKGKGSDEQTLRREMLGDLHRGDILLGDAYFATYFLLCELVRQGIDGVFEQFGARRRGTDFNQGEKLGTRDHLVVWRKPKQKPDWMSQVDYEQAPETLKVRELQAGGKLLVTTFLCPKDTPKAVIKALYGRRWNIELDLRNIKTTLGMEQLSCKSPEMVEKEIWVYLLAYNLIRLLMAQSALLADQIPRQLSFKHAVQVWVVWQHYSDGVADATLLVELFGIIAEQRVGLRPGRVEPRALKRRARTFPLLKQSRALAREDIRKNGHPKKAK